MSHSRPCQTSRFGLRGVRSTFVHQRVEPDDVGGQRRVEPARRPPASNASAPGRKSRPRLRPGCAARAPGSRGRARRAPSAGSSSTTHELGHRQAERARQLAGDHLGDERLRALAGAAELHDVQAVVVGLDEAGQRAALAQRRHVARGGDAAQRAGASRASFAEHMLSPLQAGGRRPAGPARASRRARGGYAAAMVIAGVIAFCVVLLVLAFLFPRLSHGPQKGGHKAVGVGQRGAGHGARQARPLAVQAVRHGAEGDRQERLAPGRRGRGKMPL